MGESEYLEVAFFVCLENCIGRDLTPLLPCMFVFFIFRVIGLYNIQHTARTFSCPWFYAMVPASVFLVLNTVLKTFSSFLSTSVTAIISCYISAVSSLSL